MTKPRTISNVEQLEALVSAVRQDIVDTVLALGPTSARDLAEHLGVRRSSLYYHLEELERVGLLERDECLRDDGRSEALYSVESSKLSVEYRPDDPKNREAITRAVRSILRLTQRDFERGFDHHRVAVKGKERNLWGARGKAWLNKAELRRANELLAELSDLFSRRPDPVGRTLCAVTWVLAPIPDRSGRSP